MNQSALTNEIIVRDWLAAGDNGELDKFDTYLHAGVKVHAPLGLSSDGAEAEKAVWKEAKRKMPDIRHSIQEMISNDSSVAARIIVTGTLNGEFAGIKASNKEFRIDQVIYVHIKDGKIREAWEITDTTSLLKQLGAIS